MAILLGPRRVLRREPERGDGDDVLFRMGFIRALGWVDAVGDELQVLVDGGVFASAASGAVASASASAGAGGVQGGLTV